jgi:glycosyltransferase involved in cell wall biosynthesis
MIGSSEPCLDISVFVLSYRRPTYLRQAVRSVLAQSPKPKSIVILDNGSGEDVMRAVADFLEQGVSWEGSDVTHSALWNIQRAFDKACSKYVYVMHDDDRLCPEFLETQVKFLEEHGLAAAVACGAYAIDSDGNRIGRILPSGRMGMLNTSAGNDEVDWFSSGVEIALLYSMGGVPFPSIVYRTSCVKQVRVRSEFGKVADVVLVCELADVGPIAYRHTELLEYRLHPGQDSRDLPDPLIWKLDDFLIRRGLTSPMLGKAIYRNIRKRETQRSLARWMVNVKRNRSTSSLTDGIRLVRKPYFSWQAAPAAAIAILAERLRMRAWDSMRRVKHTKRRDALAVQASFATAARWRRHRDLHGQ